MLRRSPSLLVLLAMAVPACGGEDLSSAPCTDRPGGSTVVLEYRAAAGEAPGSAKQLCSRLRALGSYRYQVATTGLRGVRVVAPDTEGARSALRAAVEGTSFYIYDWEPNVLGPRGPAAPFAGGSARSDALALAKSQPGRVAVVEDERVPGQPPQLRRYFVIKDDPDLDRSDITNPRAASDEISGEPTVAFDFTAAGREKFRRLTERVAARGARAGASEASFQHFAIVVEGRILSLAAVDAATQPNGIDARGAQINGVGSLREAKLLARRFAMAPLAAELEPISSG